MNRNQKIALGCGGAGCLGLIVVAIAAGVIWLYMRNNPSLLTRNSNHNVNINSNSNTSIADDDSNSNSDSGSNSSSSSASAASMSDDDKHKLYYAATATKDTDTMMRVWKKLGLTGADGAPNEAYREFAKEHIGWLFRNTDFMQEINTEEKARAYVDAHIND